MNEREELELLCSRHLDGELDSGEQARLEAALASDEPLRAFMQTLTQAHGGMQAFAAHRLSESFREDVLEALTPVHRPSFRALAAVAAALLLVAGAVFTAVAFQGGDSGTVLPPFAQVPDVPMAHVVAFSSDELEVRDAAGRVWRQKRVDQPVAMPAELRAPNGAYAVLQLGDGSVVLSPGSSARLQRNGDDVPRIADVQGEVYLESWARTRVSASLDNVLVSVSNGGATLRRTGAGFTAEPSYGAIMVGPQPVNYRERAHVSGAQVMVDSWEPTLPAWVVDGRAGAIRQELRTLLGEHYAAITPEQWQRGEKILRGVLSRPAERALHAYSLRLLLRHGFFDDSTESELEAWRRIAEILGEGTGEADIPPQALAFLQGIEQQLEQNPEAVQRFRASMRQNLERMAEENRRNGG